jgi:5-methylcytosine-specific restriction endonuclease McrA
MLKNVVASSFNLEGVVKGIGLRNTGGNRKSIRKRIAELQLNTSHFSLEKQYAGIKSYVQRHKLTHEELFCENSLARRGTVKKELLRLGVKHECAICGQGSEHNAKPLVLVLDHINGVRNDNRITNLRFLCPNCHSQTETFAGRNIGKSYKGSTTLSESVNEGSIPSFPTKI